MHVHTKQDMTNSNKENVFAEIPKYLLDMITVVIPHTVQKNRCHGCSRCFENMFKNIAVKTPITHLSYFSNVWWPD